MNGRIKRVYDEPRTPYQRLMGSRQIDRKTKRQLREIYETLNPAELNRRLTELREQLEAISGGKPEALPKPAYRGPAISIGSRRKRAAMG